MWNCQNHKDDAVEDEHTGQCAVVFDRFTRVPPEVRPDGLVVLPVDTNTDDHIGYNDEQRRTSSIDEGTNYDHTELCVLLIFLASTGREIPKDISPDYHEDEEAGRHGDYESCPPSDVGFNVHGFEDDEDPLYADEDEYPAGGGMKKTVSFSTMS